MSFEQLKQFEGPKQGDTKKEQYVGDTVKRMDDERKKIKFEYAERQRKIHEVTGWQLVSDKPETVTEERGSDEIENEYWEKNKDKNFWEIDLVAVPGSENIAYYAKPGDPYYVYMRTKEEVEKSKERHKETRKELVKTIHETLKDAGFKRKASTWRREVGDLVQIFNLQTSRFAYDYMINIGIFDRKRNKEKPAEKIDEVDCHYRWRLEDFMSKKVERTDYDDAMDFEAIPNKFEGEPPEMKQIEKIKDYIEKYAVPFFEEAQTEEKVKEFEARLKEMQWEEEKENV